MGVEDEAIALGHGRRRPGRHARGRAGGARGLRPRGRLRRRPPDPPVDALNYLSTGAGFDVRLGWRFRVPYQPLWITPELAAGYTDLSANIVRVRPGLRIAFGNFVIPFAYAHFGFGWTSYDPLGVNDRLGTTSYVSAPGYAFDAGAGVDFAVLRRLTVGAHLGYNMVGVGEVNTTLPDFRANWINVGLNAAFHF